MTVAGPRRYRFAAELPPVIPVFPLTGVLLLPRARLPLNIFEPRYLTMVDEAMSGSRLIGMIQPRIAGEDAARNPALCDVGCVGRIVDYSETDDGRYLITLHGVTRFRVKRECDPATPFRQVEADYRGYTGDFDAADPPIAREQLIGALKPYLDQRDMRTDWESIESASAETLVNALAMLCPFGPAEKQALLEAPALPERAATLIALLEMANAAASTGGGGQPIN